MLVVIGDTHGTDDHRLDGAVLDAVRTADRVVHTGDFTREPVLDAVQAEAGHLLAVVGNNDDAAIRDRLPATRTVEAAGRRFVVAHGHRRGDVGRELLAREAGADAVVVGHSHRPGIRTLGDVVELNPGSYANPRQYEPAYATIARAGNEAVLRLCRPDGVELERARLSEGRSGSTRT